MILGTFYRGIEIHRSDKMILVRFLKPHRVISTCRVNGGLREGLKLIINHQSCEPIDHNTKWHELAISEPHNYLKRVCEYHGVPESCAMLSTAANMNCAAIAAERFRELEVVSICTAGIETNAGRVGEPASYYETGGREPRFEKLGSNEFSPGTINIIICINKELIPGAMVRAVVTATEAKTAVLQELNISSRYSDGLATGTGTDQITVACAIGDGTEEPLTSAGKHVKLGELIGIVVKKTLKESLLLQNSITPSSRCSVLAHVERFGTDRQKMINGVKAYLREDVGELFEKNFTSIDHDPVTVAATSALVHVRDKLAWGVLPLSCLPEVFSTYGAHLASAVAVKYDRFPEYKEKLDGLSFSLGNESFLDLTYRCLAMGFNEKWEEFRQDKDRKNSKKILK